MKSFQGEFIGSVKLNKIQLNEDMLQRIDVIVYNMVMDRCLVGMETGTFMWMGSVVYRTLVPLQAFRLGMGEMVTRQFSCNINRNGQILVKEMIYCPCGGRLLGISITGDTHLRHRFLRFRGLLSVCHCHGEYQQDC